ncbi:MAG: YcaQ family DNA glycosylase [Ktedonobacteraceae bacterium]|nr:YcaQ family DNA glycosylase [Ktedonobacteraceae bacterium]
MLHSKHYGQTGGYEPVLTLSRAEARRFLANYHFTSTDVPGVFERLGTVQYDPLNPVGRNPDLVLQARVPGYQVDDWQKTAYTDRVVYDAWDKMACLVPVGDWPMRAMIRSMYRPYHDREILQTRAGIGEAILAAIDREGPLSSLEFENELRTPIGGPDKWGGATHVNRALRAMWVCGLLLTHHRQGGRHYYDRPERVIPAHHYSVPEPDEESYYRWIVARRHQATGLLRPGAEASVWSACGKSPLRRRALEQLVEAGLLLPVQVHAEGKAQLYHMPANLLPLLEKPAPEPRMLFLGPLDSLLWDRRGVMQLFDFEYIWEVYKPEPQRRWGYYVLPVFYGDRFVARLDSRLERGSWTITRWWWEPDVTLTADLLDALQAATRNFARYLRADSVRVEASVAPSVRQAMTIE